MSECLKFQGPVTLVGDGPLDSADLDLARRLGPTLIAADGAGDRLVRMGVVPDALIGDMDSASAGARASAGRVLVIPEQDTTDFEKCLYATEAPLYLAVGFTGGRVDHTLAVFHALLSRPEKRVVLLGEADAMALAPPGRALTLAVGQGARVSIFPLQPVRGLSRGLEWPLDGLELAPGRRIGTSNRAIADEVTLRFEGPGALLLLERRNLDTLVAALATLAEAPGGG